MMNRITLIHLSVNIILWMHTAGSAHGNTESPPWITLSGCFNYSINNATSNIQNNEPTLCFKNCTSSQSVALKNRSCICSPLNPSRGILINSRCNLSCPGKSEVFCGREDSDNELISVYTRDTTLLDGINGSYGYGYVDISAINNVIHASDNNTSLKHGFLCYKDFDSECIVDKSSLMTWKDAFTLCNSRSARLITASDLATCATGSCICHTYGTYWIGIYREKPDFTTLTTTTSISTTSTSTSTRVTSTSFTSSNPTISFITTTGLRPSHNSDTPVKEPISKASSSDGFNAVAVAVPVAVIVVAILVVLVSILLCKKRKLLCFKERHQSGKMDDSNNASPQWIPELTGTMPLSSVPPGSTLAPFQSQRHYDRPTPARERDIQDGDRDQRLLNSGMSYTNMGGETQYRFGDPSVGSERAHNEIKDTMQSNMNVGQKRKKKRERKRPKKEKHSLSVDKEYEDRKSNTEDNYEHLYSHSNDDLSVVNGRTEHSNGEGQVNETKKKTQRAKENTYSDKEMKNASPETGSGIYSEHHSKRRVATISQLNDMGNLPDEPNDIVKHNQGYGGIFDAPAATPVIDERLRKKHRKSRMKDEKCRNEDRPDQAGPDSNEVLQEPTDNNSVTRKEKKKKRKKSRERSKEKLQNGYEVGDIATAWLVPDEQTDLQNVESSKKHKKKRKKKHKKRDEMNAAKQEGLDLEKDENDQTFNIRL